MMIEVEQPRLVDPTVLRRVCGTFPTGVAVVSTVGADGIACGLTINSFASVSLTPPLVLWSLNRNSPNLQRFDEAEHCAISFLAEDQADIANRFAKRLPDKFEGVALRPTGFRAPVIEGCASYMQCSAWQRVEAGDHVVYIWQVEHAEVVSTGEPLTFHAGHYRRLYA